MKILRRIRRMKKQPRKPKSKLFNFRCDPDEIESFKRHASREGFDSATAWILWHLRRIIRDATDRE